MKYLLYMAGKDIKLILRDRMGLLFIFVVPMAIAVFFGFVSSEVTRSGSSSLDLAVIDRDQSDASGRFVDRLTDTDGLHVVSMDRVRTAKKDVRRKKIDAFVVLPPGFGDQLSFFAGSSPSLRIGVDNARRASTGFLKGVLNDQMFRMMREEFAQPDRMKKRMQRSVKQIQESEKLSAQEKQELTRHLLGLSKFASENDEGFSGENGAISTPGIKTTTIAAETKGPDSSFAVSFPQGILWALLACTFGFANSLVSERVEGTLLRLRTSPMSKFHVLGGKALACFLSCSVVVLIFLALGWLLFGLSYANPVTLALAVLANGICFSGFMMFISVLGKTERAVSGAGWALMIILAMFGGGMIPLLYMPDWMATASNFSPVKWGIFALEAGVWRGLDPRSIVFTMTVLVGSGIGFFLVGFFVFQVESGD